MAALVFLLVFAGALGYRIYLLKAPAPAQKVSLEIPPAPATPPAAPPSPAATPQAAPSEPTKPRPFPVSPPKPVASKAPADTPAPPETKAAAPAPAPEEPPAQETPKARPRPRVEIFRPDAAETSSNARPAAPEAAAAYSGPSAGTLIWSGQVEKDTLVTINGDQASIGRLTGELPGVPVKIQLETDAFTVVEPPSPANHWKRLSLRSLKRVRSGVVIKWGLLDANR